MKRGGSRPPIAASTMGPKHRQWGVSLLEAIVALAILSAAGLALFAAMNQSVQMVARAEQARLQDAAMRDALGWAELINPMEQRQGVRTLGGYEVRWNSDPIEPERDGSNGYMRPGLYRIGLYRVNVQIWRSGRLQGELTIRRAGWKQVRKPEPL